MKIERELREKAEQAKKEDSKKKDNAKSGQTSGLSGRELFSYNPAMVGEEVMFKLCIVIETGYNYGRGTLDFSLVMD